jgi:hypothetical protein
VPAINPAVRSPFWPVNAQNSVVGAAAAAAMSSGVRTTSRSEAISTAKLNTPQASQAIT